jgi:hypothetical protein
VTGLGAVPFFHGVFIKPENEKNGVDGWTAILARLILCSMRKKKKTKLVDWENMGG